MTSKHFIFVLQPVATRYDDLLLYPNASRWNIHLLQTDLVSVLASSGRLSSSYGGNVAPLPSVPVDRLIESLENSFPVVVPRSTSPYSRGAVWSTAIAFLFDPKTFCGSA